LIAVGIFAVFIVAEVAIGGTKEEA